MANIGKIGTSLKENLLYKPMKWLGNNKYQKKLNKGYQVNDASIIGGVGVASILLKDGLGCYMYVTQSLNNDKIPDDKRKFVAALDLVNGILMISLQFLMFKTISNKMFQAKMFDKLFGKFFDRNAAKGYAAALNGTEKFKGLTGDKFHPALQNYKDTISSAFAQLTSLAAATIVAKRMLVPFIATPLAGKAKDWMSRNDKPVVVNEGTKNSYDSEKKVDVAPSTNTVNAINTVNTTNATNTTETKETKETKVANAAKIAEAPVTQPQVANSTNFLANYVQLHKLKAEEAPAKQPQVANNDKQIDNNVQSNK